MVWEKKPDPIWTCEECGESFPYYRIDNRMNGSWYAYCIDCGMTGLMSEAAWVPADILRECGYELSNEAAHSLPECECGGRFMHGALPRCPECITEISREKIIGMLDFFYKKREWSAAIDSLGSLQNCIVIEERIRRFR